MRWLIPLVQRTTVGVSPEKKSPRYELKASTEYTCPFQGRIDEFKPQWSNEMYSSSTRESLTVLHSVPTLPQKCNCSGQWFSNVVHICLLWFII